MCIMLCARRRTKPSLRSLGQPLGPTSPSGEAGHPSESTSHTCSFNLLRTLVVPSLRPHHRSETQGVSRTELQQSQLEKPSNTPLEGRLHFFCYGTAPSTGARQKYHLVRWFLIEPDKPVVESTHNQVTAGKPPGFYLDI